MDDAKIVQLYWDRDERAIPATASKYGNYWAIAKMRRNVSTTHILIPGTQSRRTGQRGCLHSLEKLSEICHSTDMRITRQINGAVGN